MGNIPPVIMAITVPMLISTMSQLSANLNYKHEKEQKIRCKRDGQSVESQINVSANDEKTKLTTVMGPTVSLSWGFSLF